MTTHASPEPSPATFVPADPDAAPADVAGPVRTGVWLVHLLLGLVTIVAGVLALAWPDKTVVVVAVIFGVQALIAGVLRLLEVLLRPEPGTPRAVDAAIGVLFVAVGLLCLRDVLHTVAVLTLLLGMVWLVGGLLEVIGALADGLPARWTRRTVLSLLSGVVAMAGGLLVLAYPAITLGALALLLGLSLVLHGVTAVVQAFRLRSL